jgi:hypothetical protein
MVGWSWLDSSLEHLARNFMEGTSRRIIKEHHRRNIKAMVGAASMNLSSSHHSLLSSALRDCDLLHLDLLLLDLLLLDLLLLDLLLLDLLLLDLLLLDLLLLDLVLLDLDLLRDLNMTCLLFLSLLTLLLHLALHVFRKSCRSTSRTARTSIMHNFSHH